MPTAADHRAKAEEYLVRAAQALSPSQRREYLELAAQWRELASRVAWAEGGAAPLVDGEAEERG